MSNCSLSSLLLLSLVALLQAAVWDLELCKTREAHWTLHDDHHDGDDHGYIYSGQSEENPGLRDWFGAKEWCQSRCMDLVSLETEEELREVREMMEETEAELVWTSGYRVDGESSIWTGSGEIISSEDWLGTFGTTSKAESCLALTKVKDLTGLTCHKTMEWICEDSDGLLAEAGLI